MADAGLPLGVKRSSSSLRSIYQARTQTQVSGRACRRGPMTLRRQRASGARAPETQPAACRATRAGASMPNDTARTSSQNALTHHFVADGALLVRAQHLLVRLEQRQLAVLDPRLKMITPTRNEHALITMVQHQNERVATRKPMRTATTEQDWTLRQECESER
jgi:hypothetical protein